MAKLRSVKGMNDLLPAEIGRWHRVERTFERMAERYGFAEVRTPILEPTELFVRSIGEVTDIVEKEMYTFDDRNGDSLTLRPEGTAGCVRAAEEHGLLFNQTRRLWYTGPMFRHERPQKGRYRQFHQFGVECFGMDGPDIDAELLILTSRLWQDLGLEAHARLEINSIGTAEARAEYRQALVDYLGDYRSDLDPDSQRRLLTNPLRILDSKNTETQRILEKAPSLDEYLDDESREHFEQLTAMLDAAGVPYTVNNRLVRGLDYYGKTVFEWVTDSLGAQGTICAGGRYDGLVEQLGGRPTTAVGFAMGVERLILLLETLELVPPDVNNEADVYVTAMGEAAVSAAFRASEAIRSAMPGRTVVTHCGGGSFKSQMKKADRSGARVAIIIGENEVRDGAVGVKYLREERDQEQVSLDQVGSHLASQFANT